MGTAITVDRRVADLRQSVLRLRCAIGLVSRSTAAAVHPLCGSPDHAPAPSLPLSLCPCSMIGPSRLGSNACGHAYRSAALPHQAEDGAPGRVARVLGRLSRLPRYDAEDGKPGRPCRSADAVGHRGGAASSAAKPVRGDPPPPLPGALPRADHDGGRRCHALPAHSAPSSSPRRASRRDSARPR